MPDINLLDPSLGIQRILDTAWASKLPEARQLAATVLRAEGLDELFAPANVQALTESALCPEVGDGSQLEPGPFFNKLHECLEEMRGSQNPEVQTFVEQELRPLLENRDLFGAYAGLMIGG